MTNRIWRICAIGCLTAVLVWLVTGASEAGKRKPWKAPKRAKKKKNPVPATKASIKEGEALYKKECLSCHGKHGEGDGPAVAGLDVSPADLTDPKMHEQTDGELYWKIKVGRTPMPSSRGRLKPMQRWHLVNFLRTLEKKASGKK